jgi:molybdate transport system ATP-binding protein
MKHDPTLHVRIRLAMGTAGQFELDAAFDVPPGITILFGHSGAGKSTTLAAIAGLVRPDSGQIALGSEVWFDGARGVSLGSAARRLSYVFQSLALFPHMTALQNVAFGIERRSPRAERRRIALETLERMKVAHLAHRRPSTCSGGEAQRVALARAFARSPRLVLLDEAFSALDRELKRELWLDIRRSIEELGIPAIQITHQVDEARAMGDRLVRMDKGRVIETGSIALLRDEDDAPRCGRIERAERMPSRPAAELVVFGASRLG